MTEYTIATEEEMNTLLDNSLERIASMFADGDMNVIAGALYCVYNGVAYSMKHISYKKKEELGY